MYLKKWKVRKYRKHAEDSPPSAWRQPQQPPVATPRPSFSSARVPNVGPHLMPTPPFVSPPPLCPHPQLSPRHRANTTEGSNIPGPTRWMYFPPAHGRTARPPSQLPITRRAPYTTGAAWTVRSPWRQSWVTAAARRSLKGDWAESSTSLILYADRWDRRREEKGIEIRGGTAWGDTTAYEFAQAGWISH
ncbi:hypothetical protein VUR80DRAFT_2403 [Thermomyces stellatus]